MNTLLQNDLANLDTLLEAVKEQSLDFIKDLNERSTDGGTFDSPNAELQTEGIGALKSLELFNQKFEPIIVSSGGPRYWGYVTGGSTPASVIGDWLATVYDQNTQGINGQGDISANIEFEAVNLLLDLFGLPKTFLGGFVTGATMSSFTSLAVARQWYGRQLDKDFSKNGISGKVNILTATPHSSVIKSLGLLGIGSANIIQIATIDKKREAISIPDLEKTIKDLDGEPFILVSSGGTVNTVDFDDFTAIKILKETYNFWWHIDAAFGGFAACTPATKHLVKDWEHADSITIDCHKWLNVPYESAVFFIKEKHKNLQIESFQNSNAPYLGDPMENFTYLNFLPENSRRLKALPAWFTLIAYGKDGYREIVENSISLAQLMSKKIDESDHFKMLAPVLLNNLCFTLKGAENQPKVSGFLTRLNETGKVFMTPTIFDGQKGIRASFVNWRTSQADIELVFNEMNRIAEML